MPTIERWIKIHADLMTKLHLPCKLEFSTQIKVGSHAWRDGECSITVNPEADFRVPEHLLLHEAAHHRVIEPFIALDVDDLYETQYCHAGFGGGHCEHWAQTLYQMYRETGTPLPQITSFFEFAKIAGVMRKNFVREGDHA